MELELGLKITKTKESLTSTDLRIAKDRAGPVFFSRETENMFVLTAHLKGFKRERIKIDISRDGTRISISGDKPVQEVVMKKWIMHKKEVEIKGFRKVFRIPEGVVTDKIKAKFNEKETILSIFMPKSVAGIQGLGIEEVKDEVTESSGSTTTTQAPTVQVPEAAPIVQEPEAAPPELKPPEIIQGKDVNGEDELKLPQVEQEEAEKNIAPMPAQEEVEKNIAPMSPINVPGNTTENQEKEVTETMQVQPEETQQQQSPALPEENIDTKNVIPEQEPEQPAKVDRELNQPEPQEEDSNSETQEELHREKTIEDVEQEIKEPEKPAKVDEEIHLLKPLDEPPANALQSENHHREESTEDKQEIKETDEQSETVKDFNSGDTLDEQTLSSKTQEVQDEEQPKNQQIEDRALYREEIQEETEILENKQVENYDEVGENETNEKYVKERAPKQKSQLYGPYLLTGSAFFGLFIVFVVHLMKKSSKSKKS